MTQTIMLTRGLPASGKSTFAVNFIAENPGWVRLERDLLRDQLFNSRELVMEREEIITKIQRSMAEAAIKAGNSVLISDMNLRAKYVREWAAFAAAQDVGFTTIKFDNVTVDECVARDKDRNNSVGEEVIRNLAKKFMSKGKIPTVDVNKELDLQPVGAPYEPDTTKPKAILVDIDGTVAKMADRSPYEWHRVGEDTPVAAVIEAVHSASQFGREIIFMSGRDESCRAITEDWLTTNLGVSWHHLYMRPEGDNRKDNIIKLELFNKYVRTNYNIAYVLDDRDQVVKMWRSLGLACFQVAEGKF